MPTGPLATGSHSRTPAVIAALTIVGVVAGSMAAAGSPHPTPPPTPVNGTPSPFPTALATPAPSLLPPKLRAAAAILEDMDTGQVLLSRKSHTRRPIASLTKIMTALLVLERLDPGRQVTVSATAASQSGSLLGLKPGERISVRDLLYAMMLQSSNDAAVALAESVSGTVGSFVELMNRRARRLGLRETTFFSPSGLDDQGYSTAADLAALTRVAEADKELAQIVERRTFTIPAPSGPPRHVQNRNVLLWLYRGETGVKTGFTTPAGNCLVATAERGGRRLVAVVLGEPKDPFDDGATLLDYGFHAFADVTLLQQGASVATLTVDGRAVSAVGGRTVTRLVRQDLVSLVERRFLPLPGLHLPVRAGERVGKVIVFLASKKVASAPAVAAAAVSKPVESPRARAENRDPIDAVFDALGLVVRSVFGSFL